MRIISQDGTIDVPYENADLERKGKIISVWTLDNVYGSFARYSTEEKAILWKCAETGTHCAK